MQPIFCLPCRLLPLPLLGKAEEYCICWLLQLPALPLQSSFPHTATAQYLCLENPGAELLLGDRYKFSSQKRLASPNVSPDLLSSWARLPASLPSAPQSSHPWYLTTSMQENVLKAGSEPCFNQVTRTPEGGHLAPNFQGQSHESQADLLYLGITFCMQMLVAGMQVMAVGMR